jgi:ATP phosphoribosyltransferase regulatory subunit HisZ
MPRRPAAITQADIARAIRAAKQAGAVEVEVRVGDASVIVRLVSSTGAPTTSLEESRKVVL